MRSASQTSFGPLVDVAGLHGQLDARPSGTVPNGTSVTAIPLAQGERALGRAAGSPWAPPGGGGVSAAAGRGGAAGSRRDSGESGSESATRVTVE